MINAHNARNPQVINSGGLSLPSAAAKAGMAVVARTLVITVIFFSANDMVCSS